RTVQVLEHPKARARVSRDLYKPHLLPGTNVLTRLGDVLFKTDFTCRKEKEAPEQARPRPAMGLATPLPRAVAEHVGHPSSLTRIDLLQLIEAQQIVVVGQSYAFQSVCRSSPALQPARFAPHGRGHEQCCGFAGAAVTSEVHAARFLVQEGQQGRSKSGRD